MRKPSPLSLLLTPALFAFAASTAHAVATVSSSSAAPAHATSSTATGMSTATMPQAAPPASASTTTSSSSSTSSSGTPSSSGTTTSDGTFNPLAVTGIPNQRAIGPTAESAPFAPGGTFATDNNNPELGTSPGQTSPGTAVGNEPSGLDVGTATLDANGNFDGVPASALGAGAVAPVDVIGGVSGGYAGSAAPAMGGTAVAIAPGRSPATGASATPLLDQATRNAEQRLARERATGRTPRVIGIAPNTNADRTDEMPDDPIIRY